MRDDSHVPPLTQRAPGKSSTRRPEPQYTPVVLPASVVQRVRAALESSREQEQAAFPEAAGVEELTTFQEAPDSPQGRPDAQGRPDPPDLAGLPDPAGLPNPSEPAALAARHATPPSPWFPVSPEDDTQQFPAISGSARTDQEVPVRDLTSGLPERDPRPGATITSEKHKPSAASEKHKPSAASEKQKPSAAAPASGSASRRAAATAASKHSTGASWHSAAAAAPSGRMPAARPARAPAPRGRVRRYRITGVLISVVVLVATGSVAFALSQHDGEHSHRAPAPAVQTIPNIAAAWVAGQVGAGDVVSCDPATCQALTAHGIPAARLLTLSSGRTDPLRSQVIVATKVVRNEFGRRLGSAYAPAVIASFGHGNLRIDIRVIAPHGAVAYRSAVRKDVQNRKDSGSALLRSPQITTSAVARSQLVAGRVDWRLMISIADLGSIRPVSILAFGDRGPGASPSMPLRSADLAEAAGPNGRASPAYVRSMISSLRAEGEAYVPAHIRTVRLTTGQAALRIEFAAPSPVGLPVPRQPGLP